MAKTENGGLTKTERTELIRIVRGRFKLLRDGLYVRAAEVRMAVERQIDADHAKEIEKYEKKGAEITEKVNALLDQLTKLEREAEKKGITGRGITARLHDPKWTPAHKQSLIDHKLAEIGGLNGRWEYELKRQENELVEDLIMGNLESDDAQTFLAKIPTAETLIPLPSGVQPLAVLENK